MSERKRLLFVDDETRILNSVRAMFRREFTVATATSAEEALKLLEAESFDALISDERMPGMRGHELLGVARERWPGIARILLSGFADKEAISSSINNAEIFRFVQKPWQVDRFKQTVVDAVNHHAGPPRKTKRRIPLQLDSHRPELVLVISRQPDLNRRLSDERMKVQVKPSFSAALSEIVHGGRASVLLLDGNELNLGSVQWLNMIRKYRHDLSVGIFGEVEPKLLIKLINNARISRVFDDRYDWTHWADDVMDLVAEQRGRKGKPGDRRSDVEEMEPTLSFSRIWSKLSKAVSQH